jgi:DNA end-binding protein Ku
VDADTGEEVPNEDIVKAFKVDTDTYVEVSKEEGEVRGPVRSCAGRPHHKKRAGQPITKKDRPAGGNVVDLMEALRRSVGGAEPAKTSKASKKPRKAASGQKEMLMPIEGKKANETPAKKSASKPQRKSA